MSGRKILQKPKSSLFFDPNPEKQIGEKTYNGYVSKLIDLVETIIGNSYSGRKQGVTSNLTEVVREELETLKVV